MTNYIVKFSAEFVDMWVGTILLNGVRSNASLPVGLPPIVSGGRRRRGHEMGKGRGKIDEAEEFNI